MTQTTETQAVQKLPVRIKDDWPTHGDGRLKTFGELTKNEKREVIKLSTERMQREFDQPDVRDAIAKLLAPKATVTPSSDAKIILSLLESTYKPNPADKLPSIALLDPNHLPVFCKLHGNIVPLGTATNHAEAEKLGLANGVSCNKISRAKVNNEDGTEYPKVFFLLH